MSPGGNGVPCPNLKKSSNMIIDEKYVLWNEGNSFASEQNKQVARV